MTRRVTKVLECTPYRADQLGLVDEENLVWGIYVGGCVDDGAAWRLWREEHGHAHNDTKDPWFGWICILETKDVLTRAGNPSSILLHEYAHLIVPNQGHNAKWKRIVTELGAGREVARIKKQMPMPSVKNARNTRAEQLRTEARRLK
jgi:hypothetical protein